MNCSTPKIDEEQTMDLPLDLTVSFIMDNLSIAPHDDILVVVADPIYYPFENFTQQINASGLLHIQVRRDTVFSSYRLFVSLKRVRIWQRRIRSNKSTYTLIMSRMLACLSI